MSRTITIEQFQDVAEPIVVDLRNEHEFDAGHIPGAVRVAQHDLGGWTPPAGHDVVLIGDEEVGADSAADVLQARGLDARVLEGGMAAYLRAGLPAEPDARTIA